MKWQPAILGATVFCLAGGCSVLHLSDGESGEPAGWLESTDPANQPPDGHAILSLDTFRILDPEEIRALEFLYLNGTVVEGLFYPDMPLRIQGPLRECPEALPVRWMRGWIEFAPLERHLDVEGATPRDPYVRGCFDPQGRFYPERM
jgi:hypothetical protein